MDDSFGVGGMAGGRDVSTALDGRLLVAGYRSPQLMIVGLTRDGSIDPSFRSGQPVPVEGFSFPRPLLRHANGTFDVLSEYAGLSRFTADGVRDESFGDDHGRVTRPVLESYLHCIDRLGLHADAPECDQGGSSLLADSADRTLLFERTTGAPRLPWYRSFEMLRFDSKGPVGPDLHPAVPFGGGLAKLPLGGVRCCLGPEGVADRPPLDQSSFDLEQMIRLADGSFLVVGGVSVGQYVGAASQGDAYLAGLSAGFFATAKLTPSFSVDTTYGGPPSPARARVTLPAQSARRDARLGRVLVRVTATQPGLMQLRVRDHRGALLASRLAPIYAAGPVYVRVGLTLAGSAVLERSHNLRVTIGHQLRGIVAGNEGGRTTGRLR